MKTPFYDCHLKSGGKVVDFHGWDLPIQYAGIIKEHNNVRENAGLFDVSHMGEFLVEGEGALELVDYIVTNSVYKLEDGQAIYTPMCRKDGTTVDDLLVYRINSNKILLVVNAANIEKDFNHVSSFKKDGINIENVSDKYAQLAIQGPKAAYIIDSMIEENVDDIGFFRFIFTKISGIPVLLSRTGYTQEDGFEIYFTELERAEELWDIIIKNGDKYGLKPTGLGARDTLRFEGALMLYGNDLDDTTTPIEARLNWAVDLNKDFNGKDALKEQKDNGPERRLCGIELIDKGIARNGYNILSETGDIIGKVTSGTKSPTIGKALALGYVKHPLWKKDNVLYIEIRNKKIKAKTVKYPFYKKPSLTMVQGCSNENN